MSLATNNQASAESVNHDGESQTMTMMMEMQQQQMQMQQQMTLLMTRLLDRDAGNANSAVRTTPLKLERPTIDADSTDNKWIIFKDAWIRYKDMAKLSDIRDIRNELRSTCSQSVNEMLFNFIGPTSLNSATEEEMLNYIKSVSVKTVHPEVYRQQFFTMKQTDGESITRFISRLKSQAMLCDLKIKCDCQEDHCVSSYSEDMIKSQLIGGIRNSSHQIKILSEVATLETLMERLLMLESTEKASSHF